MGNNVMERAKSGPEQGNPNPPNSAQIDVYLTKGCPNPKFEIVTALPKDPSGNPKFDNNHRPGFNIRFVLHDQTGSGYVFAPVPDDACWSQWGTSCPSAPVYEVFSPLQVNGTTLDVYNDNPPGPQPGSGMGVFHYTLRVTNDGGETYCDLDPGGVDNNGARTVNVA
jgi:hypothetical protein